MPNTLIPLTELVELRATGRAEAASCPFVNPTVIYQCRAVLARRGESWAEAVLGRPLTGRSLVDASFPMLREGDPETLVLADIAEDRASFNQITSTFSDDN